MLSSLRIHAYRGLRGLSLAPLARVVVLVGPNNVGKSSVLEAVELLASQGRPKTPWGICVRRDEILRIPDDFGSTAVVAEVRHLFPGHGANTEESLHIEAPGESLAYQARFETHYFHPVPPSEVPVALDKGQPGPTLSLVLDHRVETTRSYPLTSEGALGNQWLDPQGSEPAPAFFLSGAGGFGRVPSEVATAWQRVVLTPQEDDVVAALRLIDPRIERVAASPKANGRGVEFFVRRTGEAERVPLASMGDGMKRLFSIVVGMGACAGGYLLVDEVDAGLYPSTLRDLWSLLLPAAKRLDVQVFATTHNLDAIRGLGSVLEERPELRELATVHRMEPGRATTTALDAQDLVTAFRHGLDVR